MLISTKHIVMFDEAANDFGRIANMVDSDGSVLILRDGRPAYAVVPFSEVQEAEAPSATSGSQASAKPETTAPKAEPQASEEPRCACGRHAQSQCGCGGHGHRHGGHGHPHAHAHAEGEARAEGHASGHASMHSNGHGFAWNSHFGHGSEAGHILPDDVEVETQPTDDWDFSFQAGPGFDPLFRGGPNFSVEDFIGQVPPEVIQAGQQILGRFANLFGTGGASPIKEDPDN